MRTVLLWIVLVAATDVLAQQQRPQLQVLVEDLSEEAAKCGISKSQLDSIAALTLRNNGIQAVNERTNPYLYVQAAFVTTAANGCAFAMNMSVRGYSQSDFNKRAIGPFKSRTGSYTALCDKGGVAIGPRSDTSTNVTQTLENYLKQCLGELDY